MSSEVAAGFREVSRFWEKRLQFAERLGVVMAQMKHAVIL